MAASELLKALIAEVEENYDMPLPAPQILAVVQAAEKTRATHREWEHKMTFENALKRDVARGDLDAALAALEKKLS